MESWQDWKKTNQLRMFAGDGVLVWSSYDMTGRPSWNHQKQPVLTAVRKNCLFSCSVGLLDLRKPKICRSSTHAWTSMDGIATSTLRWNRLNPKLQLKLTARPTTTPAKCPKTNTLMTFWSRTAWSMITGKSTVGSTASWKSNRKRSRMSWFLS